MTRIARLLRARHDASGQTWVELARLCGLSSTYLHDVASGRRRVRPARARAYAAALGCDAAAWVRAAQLDELER